MASMLHINHKGVEKQTYRGNRGIKAVMSVTYERVKYYTDFKSLSDLAPNEALLNGIGSDLTSEDFRQHWLSVGIVDDDD